MVRRTRKRLVKKVLTSTGTQTDEPAVKLPCAAHTTKDIVVKIKRLRKDEIKKLLTKRDESGMKRARVNCEPSTMLHPHLNVRQSLSRLPSNYSHFVRPINNREVANSTVVNITHENHSSSSTEDKDLEAARYIKPGPKSYKMKMIRKLQKLRAPVALSTPKDKEVNCNGPLAALTEVTEGYVTTPVLRETVTVDIHEIPIHTTAVQTEEERTHSEGGSDGDPNVTVIDLCPTTAEEQRQSGVSDTSNKFAGACSRDSKEHDEEEPKTSKYIRIHAQTVHIHNHFYNT